MTTERGFQADCSYSYFDIERIGAQWRKRFQPQLSPHEMLNARQLYEYLDHHAVVDPRGGKLPLVGAVAELPPKPEARTDYEKETNSIVVTLGTDTYKKLLRHNARAWFTFFHEISHAILHTSLLVRLSTIPHSTAALERSSSNHETFRDTEWQADALAGALMMPARGMVALEQEYGGLSEAMIMDRFNASRGAAEKRLSVFSGRRWKLLNAA